VNKETLNLRNKSRKLKSELKKKKYYFIVLINIFMWVVGLYFIYYTFTNVVSDFDTVVILPLFTSLFSLSSKGKDKKMRERKRLQRVKQKVRK
jgi:membrane associated rhomboid family serine protease